MLTIIVLSCGAGMLGTLMFLYDRRLVRAIAIPAVIWLIGMGGLVGYSWWKAADYQRLDRERMVSRTRIDAENNGISRLADHYEVYAMTPRGVRRVKLPLASTRIRRAEGKKAFVETWHAMWVDDPSRPPTTPMWHLRLHRGPRELMSHYVIVLPEGAPIIAG